MSFKIDAYGTPSSLVPKSNGKGEKGEQGPQGLQGTGNIQSALLFFDNMDLDAETPQYASFLKNLTDVNGYGKFITSTDTGDIIDFNSLADNSLVEIYFHCDGKAGSSGQSNYIIAHLKRINDSPDPLAIIDIDTRSVQKGNTNHISFGPAMYKIVSTTTPDSLCINKNNQYRLEIITGRDYELSELKLVIKQIFQPQPP